MEHIRQFDWCNTEVDTEHFLEAQDLANCCMERILQNRFTDPLYSSDDDDEDQPGTRVNWEEIFAKSDKECGSRKKNGLFYVPGSQPLPPYPKVSILSSSQQFQMLRVISAENPDIFESLYIPRPTKLDYRLYEDLKDKYAVERAEYVQWARTLWMNGHNIRVLRPSSYVETVYDAESKIRLLAVQGWPKNLDVVAQIPLASDSEDVTCNISAPTDLIKVNLTELPHIQLPEYDRRLTVIRANIVPEPCVKHPSRFVLPGEKSVSILPLTEVHRELSQFACDNNAQFIASETALQCLTQKDRAWFLPVSVCKVMGPDAEKHNIIVIGSEFSIQKQSSVTRTYRAYRHLLLQALIPPEEKARLLDYWKKPEVTKDNPKTKKKTSVTIEQSDDDDDNENLVMDMDGMELDNAGSISQDDNQSDNGTDSQNGADAKERYNHNNLSKSENKNNSNKESTSKKIIENDGVKIKLPGIYTCTCEESAFERPPPRSYRLWKVNSKKKNEKFNLIVHCAHKVRGKAGEVIVEPIPEYQLDVGASEIEMDRIKSIALSLHLRKNASALLVRVDGTTGEVVTHQNVSQEDLLRKHTGLMPKIFDTVHIVLSQLQSLLPGRYLLKHEPSHGTNALLYSISAKPDCLTLPTELLPLSERDEVEAANQPRNITDSLLPIHKHRKMLPCAFTPYPNDVVKEKRKPATRQKTPPQAIKFEGETQVQGPGAKWPKSKKKNKNRNRRNYRRS